MARSLSDLGNIGYEPTVLGLARADYAKFAANARQSCIVRYWVDSISTSKYRAGKPAPTKTSIHPRPSEYWQLPL